MSTYLWSLRTITEHLSSRSRPVRWIWLLGILVLGCSITSCTGSGSGLDENGNTSKEILTAKPDSLKADSIFKLIKLEIFTPLCAKCHIYPNAPFGLALYSVSQEFLIGRPSYGVPGMQLVKPGDPAQSYLLWKLQGKPGISGFRMPFQGPYLPDSLMHRISSWINCL